MTLFTRVHQFKKIKHTIISILPFCIIILALVIVTLAYAQAKKKSIQGYSVYHVISDSMEPSIMKGALVISKPQVEYQVQDVITFQYPLNRSRTITHRLVAYEYEDSLLQGKLQENTFSQTHYYVTKGDAHNINDPWLLTSDMIYGKVWVSVPYVGYVIQFIRKPIGLVLCIIIPLLFIMKREIDYLFHIYSDNKKKIPYIKRRIVYLLVGVYKTRILKQKNNF